MTTFSSNLLTGIFGGIAGALMMHQIEKRKTKAVVKEAREEIDNFKETVNEVVRVVYDEEAKNSFERELKKVDLDKVVSAECRKQLRSVNEDELRRMFRNEYWKSVATIVKNEVTAIARENAEKAARENITQDFVEKTVKNYVKDNVEDILEKASERAIEDADIEKVIESYIDDNSSTFNKMIKKAIIKVLKENLDVEEDDDDDRIIVKFF